MVVTLPFVLLLLDFSPLQRWQPSQTIQSEPRTGRWRKFNLWRLIMEKIPFFALAAATSAVTYLVQKDSGALRKLTGTFSLAARLDNALIAYFRYLGELVAPIKLAAFYPHP